MHNLAPHRDYLEGEWRALRAAPLSTRRAMLVAALVDAYVDRLAAKEDDVLDHRAKMAERSPAIGLVMALCARQGTVKLVTEAVPVPIADYGRLSVEDFMVSLYNDHSVQRPRLVGPDGSRQDMLDVLDQAISALF